MKTFVVRIPGRPNSDATQPIWMGNAEDMIEAAKYAVAKGGLPHQPLVVYDWDANDPVIVSFEDAPNGTPE